MSSVQAFRVYCKGLSKPNKHYKKLTRQDRLKNAFERVVRKLGEEKIREIREDFSEAQQKRDADSEADDALEQCHCRWHQKQKPPPRADSIILELLAEGLSQIEIISILPVGGSRISRLAKFDPEKVEKGPRIPWHAASDEDRDAIKRQIMTWDIELSFPCCHRQPLEYIGAEEWQELYREYKEERCIGGERVLSPVRWREYVRAFKPRLRLKTASTGLCSCCYRIDVELNDPTTSDERKAELRLQKETWLDDAVRQRRDMNTAIAQYQKTWAPNDGAIEETISLVVDPDDQENTPLTGFILVEAEGRTEDDQASSTANCGHPSPNTNIQHKCFTSATAEKARKIVILCEDYGQAIPLPSYKLTTPNVNYFNSDLHLHMFNICDVTRKKNAVLLYDERTAGKDGNATSSLRWYYHCQYLRNLLDAGVPPPTMVIRVIDNCAGRNKTQCTLMLDCLLSLLLYDRVSTFYLLPGLSHMKPDQAMDSCRRALYKKNVFIPDQVVDAFNSVPGMHAEFFNAGNKVFRDWEHFLAKHLKPLPLGFTENYCFEVSGGAVVYKSLVTEESGLEHTFCTDVASTREAILAELLGLPPTAELGDIISATPRLPMLEEKPIPGYKEESIAKRLPNIPAEYRAYYPGADANLDNHQPSDSDEVDEAPPVKRKKPAGRPRKSKGVFLYS
ncbi:uncharacterized protein [Diadema antillarum]|uniref:uncharacterized protein n=1 Tax=Diadema antillarum TaxID=105358 RepID=UPI003A8529A3